MHRACEIVRYSLKEWLRYTDATSINPELQQSADLLEWLRDPVRASKWQSFHRDTLGKSGPPLVRSKAKKRDQLLAVLCKHHLLLSADGKTFTINPLLSAGSADVAARPKLDGFEVAEDLRESAENSRNESSPAKNPQLSAKSPQNGTPAAPGSSQNPRNPQPPKFSGEI
ncbi:hypothetical protein D3C76_1413020 [compost metagenome]